MISIHALREESDIILFLAAILQTQISIHALREESDRRRDTMIYRDGNFNPRSPWGERHYAVLEIHNEKSISIHALREESDLYQTNLLSFYHWISIHALREESDRVKTPL